VQKQSENLIISFVYKFVSSSCWLKCKFLKPVIRTIAFWTDTVYHGRLTRLHGNHIPLILSVLRSDIRSARPAVVIREFMLPSLRVSNISEHASSSDSDVITRHYSRHNESGHTGDFLHKSVRDALDMLVCSSPPWGWQWSIDFKGCVGGWQHLHESTEYAVHVHVKMSLCLIMTSWRRMGWRYSTTYSYSWR
jgi:hypothetical protein